MSFIERNSTQILKKYINNFPAVAILGPRQCGKSTLAKYLLKSYNSVYIDLENPDDLAKLTEPSLFFDQHKDKLVCLDEVQRLPEIFSLIRSKIDNNGRNSQFLFLGSASPELLKQTSETLAGRIVFYELTPFMVNELPEIFVADNITSKYWLRGGFPRSLLAVDNEISYVWRNNFIRTFLEKDIPNLGYKYPAETIRRLWQMIAHTQGQVVNTAQFGKSLGISHTTVNRYIDLLEQTFILRVLKPYFSNGKKRLIKSPKLYIRDTGLLHTLIGLKVTDDVLGHPVAGPSWETLVIENLIFNTPDFQHYFYRTSNGSEIDLVLQKGNKKYAIECKLSPSPKLNASFYNSINDLDVNATFVIAPVSEGYFIKENIKVCNLMEGINELMKL